MLTFVNRNKRFNNLESERQCAAVGGSTVTFFSAHENKLATDHISQTTVTLQPTSTPSKSPRPPAPSTKSPTQGKPCCRGEHYQLCCYWDDPPSAAYCKGCQSCCRGRRRLSKVLAATQELFTFLGATNVKVGKVKAENMAHLCGQMVSR